MLTQREVVPYLLQAGLLTPKEVVDGELTVIDASRRNQNFAVISEQGPCYLLKQGVGSERSMTVAHEAALYRWLQSSSQQDRFSNCLPHFYEYDKERNILILEMLRDSENLREYHVRRGRFSTSLAANMGKTIGLLHRLTRVEQKNDANDHKLSTQPPWILSVCQTDLGTIRDFSFAGIQLIKIIQQFPELRGFLDELLKGWRIESLIHFDIRWDNWVVYSQSVSNLKLRLKLIDWEIACMGDPCWDVGSVFNDYLSFWVLSIPITGETPSEQSLELARYPLNKMQPAIRSFWQSYVQQMKLSSEASEECLLRAAKYAAARLVQTAFEQMQMAVQLTGNVICLLQVSLNILRRPQEAIVHLLGIPLGKAGCGDQLS